MSDGDLRADLDDAIGRDLEVGRRVLRAARQRHEQPVLPPGISDFGVGFRLRRDRKNDVAPMSMLRSLRRQSSRIFGTLGVSMKP